MNKRRRRLILVGAALVAAGAVVAAVGYAVGAEADARVLSTLGAGLVAAGLTIVIHVAGLTVRQSIIAGGLLILTGTVCAVLGSSAVATEIRASIPPIGGTIFVAGLIQFVLGVGHDTTHPATH